MKFEWDEGKNQSNFEKHGIYFDEAIEIFKNDCLTWIDDRKDYSEIREITIGEIKKNIVIVIVHTDRFWKYTNYFSPESKSKRTEEIL